MALNVAAIQCLSRGESASENRAQSIVEIELAASRGANVVVLPELFIPGYVLDAARLERAAEPLNGPTLEAWLAAANKLNIYIAGGFCERSNGRLYNSAMLVGPSGVLLHYRKLHLFDLEKELFAPGDLGLQVVETPIGKLGLCVCYDLRFVEVMRSLALQSADLVLVPTAWVQGFDKVVTNGDGLVGQALGAAVQANLNQVFVACASQMGTAGGVEFLGCSVIVDPYGRVIAGPASRDRADVLLAAINIGDAKSAQERTERIKPRADRRTDVYQLKVNGRLF